MTIEQRVVASIGLWDSWNSVAVALANDALERQSDPVVAADPPVVVDALDTGQHHCLRASRISTSFGCPGSNSTVCRFVSNPLASIFR